MTTEAQQGGGTVLRGADGSYYYITDAQLESYRLPEDKAEAVRRVLEDDVQGFSIMPELPPVGAGLNNALGVPLAMSKTKSTAIPTGN